MCASACRVTVRLELILYLCQKVWPPFDDLGISGDEIMWISAGLRDRKITLEYSLTSAIPRNGSPADGSDPRLRKEVISIPLNPHKTLGHHRIPWRTSTVRIQMDAFSSPILFPQRQPHGLPVRSEEIGRSFWTKFSRWVIQHIQALIGPRRQTESFSATRTEWGIAA